VPKEHHHHTQKRIRDHITVLLLVHDAILKYIVTSIFCVINPERILFIFSKMNNFSRLCVSPGNANDDLNKKGFFLFERGSG
jgi:hypothetical protein